MPFFYQQVSYGNKMSSQLTLHSLPGGQQACPQLKVSGVCGPDKEINGVIFQLDKDHDHSEMYYLTRRGSG